MNTQITITELDKKIPEDNEGIDLVNLRSFEINSFLLIKNNNCK